MTRSIFFALAATISLAVFSAGATADHIDLDPPHGALLPTDLPVGSQYRLAFTDGARTLDGSSSDVALYNQRVQSVADGTEIVQDLVGSDGNPLTWKAIISTVPTSSHDGVDARDNTDTCPTCDDFPIYLLNTTRLADGNPDLWDGTILTNFIVQASGNGVSGTAQRVLTGTDIDGTASANPVGSPTTVSFGNRKRTNSQWVSITTRSNTETARLYAISDVLTVVPEPASAVLLLFGACGMLTTRRRGK